MTFELERLSSSGVINVERTILFSLGVSAVCCLSAPFFFNTDKLTTGFLLGAGTISAGLFGVSAQISEGKEKIYKSLQEADLKALKQHLQGNAAYDYVTTAIAAKRRVAAYVNRLPEHERPRWIAEYGLQGLVTMPRPRVPQAKSEEISAADYEPVVFDFDSQAQAQQVREVNILDQMVETNLSIVVAAPPRTGKTCLVMAWLAKLYQKYPKAQTYFVAPKPDEFGGLNQIPGVVIDSDPLDPLPLIQGIKKAYNIFLERRKSTKEQRKAFQDEPVWLVLTDWYSQFSALKKKLSDGKGKETLNEVLVMIGTLVTVAPEYRVGVLVDTHDFNVGSIGLADSSNLRACINLIVLGRIVTEENGKKQGNFDAIANAIRNSSIVSEGDRPALQQDFLEYKALSTKTGQPVAFSTMGYPYLMGILPNYSKFENYRLPREIIVDFARRLGIEEKKESQDKQESIDWYESIRKWVNELGRRPSYQEIKQKWQELTGQELNEKGVTLLLENLGFPDEVS